MVNKVCHIYICLTHMILETCLIFKIEKKKTKKLFFCGKNTVNPLRKKNPYRKNANCIIRTCARVLQRTRKRMSYGEGILL
jgi:hypothetical protein